MSGGREPERQCVACRRLAPRSALIRLVRTPEGAIALDSTIHQQGRGAYVCRTPECVELAARRGALQRALRHRVPEDLMREVLVLGRTPPPIASE
ncbi:MAG TPA: YlxR family protein [Oscillatoriaceae cyanobacterium]